MYRAIILMMAAFLLLVGCSNNASGIPLGKYEFEFPYLYAFPSNVARVDYAEGTDVFIKKDSLAITQKATGETLTIANPIFKKEIMDDNMVNALIKDTSGFLSLSDLAKYKNKYRFTVYESKDILAHIFSNNSGDLPANISLYVLDDELWFAPYWNDVTGEGKQYRKHDFIIRLKQKAD